MSETENPPGHMPSSDARQESPPSRPFRSDAQEATIALLRTASAVSRRLARVVEPHGISLAQFNVLRILRGAGDDGLPTLAIRDRMIEEGSTVTRLLDKLETAGYVRRSRCSPDRRQVLCWITESGQSLLALLDPHIDAADAATVDMLNSAERRDLIETLARIRDGVPATG
ncbi:MAG: MarR family transcriptional regulator [Gemmatimonadaceae bacterium]|nr:MarR family transcriptional regulator [Gemmatimonadaceae bacterium]